MSTCDDAASGDAPMCSAKGCEHLAVVAVSQSEAYCACCADQMESDLVVWLESDQDSL